MQEKNLSQVLREQMQSRGQRFWAGDNISDYMSDAIKEKLIEEATVAFEGVLDALLIDRETDPNSRGTARRLAKMYYNEIMGGRYEPSPDCTAFPKDSADR
jgi:GTP cyclohydrolase I